MRFVAVIGAMFLSVGIGLTAIWMFPAGVPPTNWRVVLLNTSGDPGEDLVVFGTAYHDRKACFLEAVRLNDGSNSSTYSCALVRTK